MLCSRFQGDVYPFFESLVFGRVWPMCTADHDAIQFVMRNGIACKGHDRGVCIFEWLHRNTAYTFIHPCMEVGSGGDLL